MQGIASQMSVFVMYIKVIALTATISASSVALTDDWAQWRGPNRDGTSSDSFAFATWPPIELWAVPLTNFPGGYASPIVSDGCVYIVGGRYVGYPICCEQVSCLDALTGVVIWTNGYLSSGSAGMPCSSPTIHGNELYTMSNDGWLRSFDKNNGSNLWSVALNYADNNNGGSGHCASPLVEGNLVILNVGNNGAAIRRTVPHDIVWSSPYGSPGYASPVAWTDDLGQRRVGIFSQSGLHVVNPLDGTVLAWTTWPGCFTIPDPIVWANRLFIATGELSCYSGVVEYTNGTLRTVWRNPENVGMPTKTGNFVRVGEYVYGYCYSNTAPGFLSCLRHDDGQVMWTMTPSSVNEMGTTIAVGNRVIFATRDSGVYVAKATQDRFDMEGRSVMNIKTAVTPAFANGRLYVKTKYNVLVCLDTGPQNDLDRDRIADKWETNYFGNANACVADADPDGDGLSNLQEYLAGTDPTNRKSCLVMSNVWSQTNGVVLHWQSATGKTYSINCSTNLLSDRFTNLVAGAIPAHPPENVWTDAFPRSGTVFYRVKLKLE